MANAEIMDLEPFGPKPRPLFAPARVLIYAALVITSLYYLIPLYVMVITSLKDLDAIRDGNIFIPTSHPTFAPWVKAWSGPALGLSAVALPPVSGIRFKSQFRA